MLFLCACTSEGGGGGRASKEGMHTYTHVRAYYSYAE